MAATCSSVTHDILAELFAIRLGHSDILPTRPTGQARRFCATRVDPGGTSPSLAGSICVTAVETTPLIKVTRWRNPWPMPTVPVRLGTASSWRCAGRPIRGKHLRGWRRRHNRERTKIRSLGERARVILKSWRLLRKLRCSTTRITAVVRAVVALERAS